MKTPIVLEQSPGGKDGFAHVYSVELLFEEGPEIGGAALLDSLRRHCGEVEPIGEQAGPFLFAHVAHRATYTDGVIPAQTLIDVMPSGPDMALIEQAVRQSWDWPPARAVVSRCRSAIVVADFMAAALAYKERLALFHQVVSAALDIGPCVAIHWRPSQRVVSPEAYLQSRSDGDALFPAVNVRLFNVANRDEGDTVMDTLGLAALGVPDLQCHFHGLDLSAVAAVLYNSADYLFENGDVIADGHTIQGLTADQKWRCRHEDAIVGPPRVVLDLDPGPPHAAGNR